MLVGEGGGKACIPQKERNAANKGNIVVEKEGRNGVLCEDYKNAHTMDNDFSRSTYCEPVSEVLSLCTEYRFADSEVIGGTHEDYEASDIFD